MRHAKKLVLPLFVAAAALALAACGGGDSGGDTVSGAFAPVAAAPAAYSELAGEAELTRADGGTDVTIQLTGLEPETEYMAHLHSEGCAGSDPGGPHFRFEEGGSDEPPNEIHLEFESNAAGEGEATAKSDREVPEGEAGSVVVHLGAHSRMSSLFVHEEGEQEGDDDAGHERDRGTDDEGGESPTHSDKVACAPLEGDAATAGGAEEEAGTDAGAAVPTLRFENGEAVGGVQKIEVSHGEDVRFKVHSDVAEEVHVHGYDLMKDVPAGGTVEFDFPAEIEGIFEAEMEGVAVQILELQVNP